VVSTTGSNIGWAQRPDAVLQALHEASPGGVNIHLATTRPVGLKALSWLVECIGYDYEGHPSDFLGVFLSRGALV
jgi:hypothetical protein